MPGMPVTPHTQDRLRIRAPGSAAVTLDFTSSYPNSSGWRKTSKHVLRYECFGKSTACHQSLTAPRQHPGVKRKAALHSTPSHDDHAALQPRPLYLRSANPILPPHERVDVTVTRPDRAQWPKGPRLQRSRTNRCARCARVPGTLGAAPAIYSAHPAFVTDDTGRAVMDRVHTVLGMQKTLLVRLNIVLCRCSAVTLRASPEAPPKHHGDPDADAGEGAHPGTDPTWAGTRGSSADCAPGDDVHRNLQQHQPATDAPPDVVHKV
ncbi:hypothetical protein C2E23DRAFT_858002 [Lenzites betulinus]|nr:hypothetical protein C2E23DRAFT_858002 [Lenzites betulinus]